MRIKDILNHAEVAIVINVWLGPTSCFRLACRRADVYRHTQQTQRFSTFAAPTGYLSSLLCSVLWLTLQLLLVMPVLPFLSVQPQSAFTVTIAFRDFCPALNDVAPEAVQVGEGISNI